MSGLSFFPLSHEVFLSLTYNLHRSNVGMSDIHILGLKFSLAIQYKSNDMKLTMKTTNKIKVFHWVSKVVVFS